MAYSYYTEEGLQRLKDDLTKLKTVDRRFISNQIAEARDKGDLSENAEYDAAKDAQGMLEMKIAQLENTVANARIIDDSNIDASKVAILSNVVIKNKANGMEMKYMIVPEEEADINTGKISIKAPIAEGVVGKKKGDSAKVKVPAGELEFEVIDVSR